MKFPNRQVLLYLGIHVVIGTLVSLIGFEDYLAAKNFFVPIDALFPTFRSFFVFSIDPTGCKVMLLLWWVFLLPWGLIWTGKYSGGFKVLNPKKFEGHWANISLLLIGLSFASLILYQHAFVDQLPNLLLSLKQSGISTAVRVLIGYGPWGFSIYLAGASLLAVLGITLALMVMRQTFFRR